jgi:hypothetical protein
MQAIDYLYKLESSRKMAGIGYETDQFRVRNPLI